MLGFVLCQIPWNARFHLERPHLCNAIRSELVLLLASSLSNIFQMEYTLTVDAIKKQLPVRNKLSIAFGGLISTNVTPMVLHI
jgi:hypothetical protein